jgi:DnaJ-class molecular chaperone
LVSERSNSQLAKLVLLFEHYPSQCHTALKFHPDMAHSSADKSVDTEERTARFRGVSEAWFVLSKSELRSQYDAARIKLGKMTGSSQAMTGPDFKVEIPTNFNTQRDSFGVALKKAGSDWKNNRDKYKCEVWHKLSHNEKKVSVNI